MDRGGKMWIFIISVLVIGNVSGNSYVKRDVISAEEAVNDEAQHGSGREKRFVAIDASQMNTVYQPCVLPNGKAGHCKHPRQCARDDFRNDVIVFMEYICIIGQSVVGVCCPDETTQNGVEGLAGELPATAPLGEQNDELLKNTRAESRGCGLSTRQQSRVLGAKPANPREWPWMASVTPEGFEQYCGGVLITNQHVLTAAHCTRRWKAEELFVRLGEYDFKRTNDSRSYNFKVLEIRQHELYQVSNYLNDIAILKLHRPAVFNTYVWPICLPPLGMELTNEVAVVIGWGTQFYGGPHSEVLMEVSVPIWDQGKCVNSFTESVFDENICAGGLEGWKDACQGDSGGPLMYQMPSGRWTVVGVVSWGVRCGEPNHPGIYTRVDKYLGWIVQNSRF